MMTRDHIVWTLAMVGAVCGYLALGTSPATWTFQQWMQHGVILTGIVAAKLGNSPLPSSWQKRDD